MRILHVATLFSPDGIYDGPMRAALDTAAELARRGHEVTIAGAIRRYDDLPAGDSSVDYWFSQAETVMPGLGSAGIGARGLISRLEQHIDDFDVVHVHLSRDMFTLAAANVARRHGVPYVIAPHGMVDKRHRLVEWPLDMMMTRPVLRAAERVLCCSESECDRLAHLAGPGVATRQVRDDVHSVATCDCVAGGDGVAGGGGKAVSGAAGGDGVAGADGAAGGGVDGGADGADADAARPEVLFLDRLHLQARPDVFIRVARRLLGLGVAATFTVAGISDDAAAEEVREVIEQAGLEHLRYEGVVAPEDVAARIAASSVYVLASVDQSFPMTVLRAMSAGRPCVVTEECGLAETIAEHRAGLVVGDSEDGLLRAVRGMLDEPDVAAAMGRRGRRAVDASYSVCSVVDELLEIYQAGVDRRAARRSISA